MTFPRLASVLDMIGEQSSRQEGGVKVFTSRRTFVKSMAAGLAAAGASSARQWGGDRWEVGQPGTPRTIRKHYAYSGSRRIHYRRAGSGPPLVMLHASPGSSFTLESLMARLSDRHTLIALDSPGYGESAGLDQGESEIADYAVILRETLDTLRLERFDLYGAHTGAKIALEFAIRHPERIRRLVIDGLTAYTPSEQADMLANYTPSLAPDWDGSHLVRGWMMRRDMYVFWPWYHRSASARRLIDLPAPGMLHDGTIDLLRAGTAYGLGPRAAIRYATLEALARLRVPTLILTTPTDALRSHLDRMKTLPPDVDVAAIEGSSSAVELLAGRIREFLAGSGLVEAPAPVAVVPVSGAVRRDYAESPVGQLLMRSSGGSAGRPLVMLHASPLSSARLEPWLFAMGGDGPVFTFDNPGNGDSPPVPGTPEVRDLANVIGMAIQGLGLGDYDVYGAHTGAVIAIELAIGWPKQVRHLILDGVAMLPQAENEKRLVRYAPPMQISSDGAHLTWAWNFIRDQLLWWPYYDKTAKTARLGADFPPSEDLHANFVEFIKGGTTYHLNYRAVFAYPIRSRLPKVSAPILFCAAASDPIRSYAAEAARLVARGAVVETPGSVSPQGVAATADLYRKFLARRALNTGG